MASKARQRCNHHEEHLHPHVVLCTWRRQTDARRHHGCKGPIHGILSPTFKFRYNKLDNIAHLLLNDDDKHIIGYLSLMRLFCGKRMYSLALFKPGSKEFTQPIRSSICGTVATLAAQGVSGTEIIFYMETRRKTIKQNTRDYYVTGHDGQWHSWMLTGTKSKKIL